MSVRSILNAGSANTDVVLNVNSVPAPGESVVAAGRTFVPGGKGANRAVAFARLGCPVTFSCCLGSDDAARELLALYTKEGVDVSAVRRTGSAGTGAAYIFVEPDGSNRIIVYPGANACYTDSALAAAADRLPECEMLCAELEIPPEAVSELIKRCVREDIPAVIDAGPVREDVSLSMFSGAYILSPNETEARSLTGVDVSDDAGARDACRAIVDSGVRYAVIKLGSRGSLCYDGSEFTACPAFSCGRVVDTTAAGDCYTAALCAALKGGAKMRDAMRFASCAAGLSVTVRGAIPSMPTYKRTLEMLKGLPE